MKIVLFVSLFFLSLGHPAHAQNARVVARPSEHLRKEFQFWTDPARCPKQVVEIRARFPYSKKNPCYWFRSPVRPSTSF